jgi:hypothetical protein
LEHILQAEVIAMTNRWKSPRNGIAAILATVLMVLPQTAAARDNCNRQDGYSQAASNSRYSYQGRAAQAYRNGAYRDSYRDSNYGYSNRRYSTDAYGDSGYYAGDSGYYPETRSAGKSAAIIGGSAAAGAAVGAMSGGLKGAAIGAAVGGVGGLIYDRTTRNNGDRF